MNRIYFSPTKTVSKLGKTAAIAIIGMFILTITNVPEVRCYKLCYHYLILFIDASY